MKILIQKNREICLGDSGPRVPYLPDVSMFSRRRKGWVILKLVKDQEKEPQSTQKGEDCINRPGRETGVQSNIKSAFQRKERILHCLHHTAALRLLSTGCDLGTNVLGHLIELWSSHKGLLGVRGSSRAGGWTAAPPNHPAPQLHASPFL